MPREEILTVIRNQVLQVVGPVELITEDSLFENLGIDGIDLVEIIMGIETELDITLPDHINVFELADKNMSELITLIENETRKN